MSLARPRRVTEIADELRLDVTTALQTRMGVSTESHLFYPYAFGRLLELAADRIASLEALIPPDGLAGPIPLHSPGSSRLSNSPARPGGDRAAIASHAERSTRT